MAWSRLQSNSGTTNGFSTFSVTYSANLTAGTKLIAAVGGVDSGTITSVKDAANNSFNLVASQAGTGGCTTALYQLDTPAGDVGTAPAITVTLSNAVQVSLLIMEVSGLATGSTNAACVDGTPGTKPGNGGASTGSPTYSSSASNEMLIAVYGDDGGPLTWTAPYGSTSANLDPNSINSSSVADCAVAYTNSTGGSESGSWALTGTGTPWAILLFAFKLASAGGSAGPPALPHTGGKQWRKRFRHRQVLPYPPAAAAAPAAPAGTVPPLITVARRSRALFRAVTGNGSSPGDGVAAPFPPPSGAQPGGMVRRRRAARAVLAGIAVAPVLAHPAAGALVAQRAPQQHSRAATGHIASAARPNGSLPGGVIARRVHQRAVTAHLAAPGRYAVPVTGGVIALRRHPRAVAGPQGACGAGIFGLYSRTGPQGSQPGGLVVRRAPVGAVAGGITVSAAAVVAPAGSPPGGSVSRRAHGRAVTGHVAGVAHPNGSPPGGIVRRRAPARAVTSHIAVPGARSTPETGGLVQRRRPARAVTGHVTGFPPPPPGTANGLVRRRAPARAVTGHIIGLVNALGPAGAQPGGLVVRRVPAGAVTGGVFATGTRPTNIPNGSPPGGAVRRRSPARAVTAKAIGPGNAQGPAGSVPGGLVVRRVPTGAVTGGLTASVVVSGAPYTVVRPQITSRRPVTTWWGGPPPGRAPAVVAAPSGSRPGGITAQRSAAQRPRAVTAHLTAGAHLNGSQPGGMVRRRAPARAVWAGTVVRTVNAAPAPPVRGTVQPVAAQPVQRRYHPRAVTGHVTSAARLNGAQPGGLTAQRKPQQRSRGLAAHVYGAPVFPPGSLQPHPSVNRRAPARARWAGTVVRTTNAPPLLATPGTVLALDRLAQTVAAADFPAATATAADRVVQVTAADFPAGTVAARDWAPMTVGAADFDLEEGD